MTMKEVQEIIDIALQVNGLAPRQRAYTGELPTVFFEMYGNAAILRIRAHGSGWGANSPDRVFEFDTDRPLNKAKFDCYKKYMSKLLKRCPQPEKPHE